VQAVLIEWMNGIRAAVPEATEKISYNMPAYFYRGPLVSFAAGDRHIGFYQTASGKAAFRQELSGNKSFKGAIQFPPGQPLLLGLVRKISRCDFEENVGK
jgi:uncharacterized protein YdhG (YjbR/CyaY superfamily)